MQLLAVCSCFWRIPPSHSVSLYTECIQTGNRGHTLALQTSQEELWISRHYVCVCVCLCVVSRRLCEGGKRHPPPCAGREMPSKHNCYGSPRCINGVITVCLIVKAVISIKKGWAWVCVCVCVCRGVICGYLCGFLYVCVWPCCAFTSSSGQCVLIGLVTDWCIIHHLMESDRWLLLWVHAWISTSGRGSI